MGDEEDDKLMALDALYGHRDYDFPVYGDWHLWFAWYPVVVFTWIDGPFGRMPFKATHWAWLRTVSRRKVKHGNARSAPNEFPNMSSEYVETFDILRLGGVQLSQL